MRRTASCTLRWPSCTLAHVGEFASSKSAMKTFAPELSALIIIFRSTGPVISTRRSCRSAGAGATVNSSGARTNDGRSPRRASRAASSRSRSGFSSRWRRSTNAERLHRQHVGRRLYANCASSVEPCSASVEESLEIACITWSKYPAPTSRWCFVAV